MSVEIDKCARKYGKVINNEKTLSNNLKKSDFEKTITKKKHICEGYVLLPPSDKYHNSTYKRDFVPPKLPERTSAEESHRDSSIHNSTYPAENKSVNSRCYVPWPPEDIKLCQAKSFKPSPNEKDVMDNKVGLTLMDGLSPHDLYCLKKYYCPPHCIEKGERKKRNCLIDYKDKFNLGPPERQASKPFQKPDVPISKYTSYLIDYRPHKMETRKPNGNDVKCTTAPSGKMSSETNYRKDFIPPPLDSNRKVFTKTKKKGKAPVDAEKKTPMMGQTTSMMDYKDPDVATLDNPRKTIKTQFIIPSCKMETETTSARSYRGWKALPSQPKLASSQKKVTDDGYHRKLVSTYQQDFNHFQTTHCREKPVLKEEKCCDCC